MVEGPRYGFHPLERRGVLLGLDLGQLLTMAAGVLAAVVVHAVIGGSPGLAMGVLLAAGSVASSVWTVDGRPLAHRLVVTISWVARRVGGPRLDDRPLGGHGITISEPAPRAVPAGIELLEDRGLPGDRPLGVVMDRRAGTLAGVLGVGGRSFGLLDADEQAACLEGWRRVLGAVGRPGSPVSRIQWVQRSWQEPVATSPPAPDGDRGAPARVGELTMLHHGAWLVLVVEPGPSRAGAHRAGAHRAGAHRAGPSVAGRTRGVDELRREMRLLEGQLRSAGLEPGAPLNRSELEELLGRPCRSGRPGRGGRAAWPLAAEEQWATYRTDATWHATYWVSEWPRVEVGPDFLTPLLVGPTSASVAVIMAPVPTDKAMREVRSARTADMADAQLRARAGFLQSARRDRESDGVARREAEMADGHQEFRFSGYLTVSAGDPEALAAVCAEAEHAAQSAHLEIRCLYGRQAEAYTWTLPLGRGLR